jgi:hypothetical protein
MLLEQDLKGPLGLIRKAAWGEYAEFAKRRVGERQKVRKCLRNAMSTCRVDYSEFPEGLLQLDSGHHPHSC